MAAPMALSDTVEPRDEAVDLLCAGYHSLNIEDDLCRSQAAIRCRVRRRNML